MGNDVNFPHQPRSTQQHLYRPAINAEKASNQGLAHRLKECHSKCGKGSSTPQHGCKSVIEAKKSRTKPKDAKQSCWSPYQCYNAADKHNDSVVGSVVVHIALESLL